MFINVLEVYKGRKKTKFVYAFYIIQVYPTNQPKLQKKRINIEDVTPSDNIHLSNLSQLYINPQLNSCAK